MWFWDPFQGLLGAVTEPEGTRGPFEALKDDDERWGLKAILLLIQSGLFRIFLMLRRFSNRAVICDRSSFVVCSQTGRGSEAKRFTPELFCRFCSRLILNPWPFEMKLALWAGGHRYTSALDCTFAEILRNLEVIHSSSSKKSQWRFRPLWDTRKKMWSYCSEMIFGSYLFHLNINFISVMKSMKSIIGM